MLEGFHLDVAKVLGDSIAHEGFALGGGYGLQAYDIIDRPSKDLDAYAASYDPQVYARAERSLVTALEGRGYSCLITHRDDWFRGIQVTDPGTGQQVVVDLGYDYRTTPPIVVENIGPVLGIEDLVLGKVRALVDRQAERDFMDVDAILQTGRWSPDDLYAKITAIRPELGREDFDLLLASSASGSPLTYGSLGLDSTSQAALHSRLETAAAGGAVFVRAHTRRGRAVRAHWRNGPTTR